MDSMKGNMEGMKDKNNQLTRAITSMMPIKVEAGKRKVASISTPPHMDGNPLQGFIYDIQKGEAKNNTLHPKGSIPTIVHSEASRPI